MQECQKEINVVHENIQIKCRINNESKVFYPPPMRRMNATRNLFNPKTNLVTKVIPYKLL